MALDKIRKSIKELKNNEQIFIVFKDEKKRMGRYKNNVLIKVTSKEIKTYEKVVFIKVKDIYGKSKLADLSL